MSGPSNVEETPIADRRELVAYLASGGKPETQWRIGTEHEKFGFRLDDLRPPTWEGPNGIEALLRGLTRFGWQPVEEHGKLIALVRDGAMRESIHQSGAETHQDLREVKTVSGELGLGVLGMGFQPNWARADMPWMPKGGYRIMRDYMPRRGELGLDMMTRTCTVQVNL